MCRRFRVDTVWQAAQQQQVEAGGHDEEQQEEQQEGEGTPLPPRPTATELQSMVYDSRALRRDATGMLPGCLLEGESGGDELQVLSRASCASTLNDAQAAEDGQGAAVAVLVLASARAARERLEALCPMGASVLPQHTARPEDLGLGLGVGVHAATRTALYGVAEARLALQRDDDSQWGSEEMNEERVRCMVDDTPLPAGARLAAAMAAEGKVSDRIRRKMISPSSFGPGARKAVGIPAENCNGRYCAFSGLCQACEQGSRNV